MVTKAGWMLVVIFLALARGSVRPRERPTRPVQGGSDWPLSRFLPGLLARWTSTQNRRHPGEAGELTGRFPKRRHPVLDGGCLLNSMEAHDEENGNCSGRVAGCPGRLNDCRTDGHGRRARWRRNRRNRRRHGRRADPRKVQSPFSIYCSHFGLVAPQAPFTSP